jgi:tRNA(fMet)-specific endonuclease VapC
MFCLDTNVIIGVMSARSTRAATRLQDEVGRGTRVLVPAIVIYELRFGIAKSARPTANERALDLFLASLETPSFDTADAAEAADIRAGLHHRGTPIGPYDILIAAQARRRSAVLVTGNVREFRRVPALTVQDWS